METDHLDRVIAEAHASLDALAPLGPALERAADLVRTALRAGHRLLVCGNGGSAAEAAHLATEFVCRFDGDRRPWPALCLNANGGDLTAIGNDYAFEEVFARQVSAFGTPGDVLVVFSSSGASGNVLRALEAAREGGLHTIAFLGRDGGRCAGRAEVELLVPGARTARIQEGHQLLLHALCERIDGDLR